MEFEDLESAVELRRWAEVRDPARKRVRTLSKEFEFDRLSRDSRRVIEHATEMAGIEISPPLIDCEAENWVTLETVGEPIDSSESPASIHTYHEHTGRAMVTPVRPANGCVACLILARSPASSFGTATRSRES